MGVTRFTRSTETNSNEAAAAPLMTITIPELSQTTKVQKSRNCKNTWSRAFSWKTAAEAIRPVGGGRRRLCSANTQVSGNSSWNLSSRTTMTVTQTWSSTAPRKKLEVINNRAGSAEKRKWSQANQRRARGARASLRRSRSDGGGDTSSDEEEYDAASGATLADGVSSRAMANGVCRRNASDVEDDDDDEDDDEEDEEVRDLTWSGRVGAGVGVGEGVMNGVHGSASSAASSARSSSQRSSSSSSTAVVPPTPVEFRASPPLHVHRPYNGSPPPKVFHAAPGVVGGSSTSSSTSSSSTSSGPTTLTLSASAHIPAFEVCAVSPRKRHRQDRGGGGTAFGVFSLVDGGPVQRPCLDFEKMQQIRVKLL
ncbi:hypothetical protein MTO96_006861 [Rhipicephalus appendiculatus]